MTKDISTKAGKREWIGLAVIALPCMLYSMDLTVLNLALPELSADLKPSSSELLWIIDIYGFMIAGLLITMGTLGDRIGRRRLLLIGSAAFGVASVLAAFSTSAQMLILNRAILGIAGATLAPSTLSLIRNMFLDEKERTVAIGIWITSYSVGGAIGPLLGGILLQYFWWGSVFLIGVPVMVVLLVVAPRLLPEFKDPDAGKMDLLSAGLSLAAILMVIFGLKKIAESGIALLPVTIIILGVVIGGIFLRRQKKLKDPLIDLQLFKESSFSALLSMNILAVFIAFGSYIFISQYLQLVLALTPLQAGLWTLPWSLGFIIGSMVTPPLANRFKNPLVMTTGLMLAALGFAVMTQAHRYGLTAIVIASIFFSIGLAPLFTLVTSMIMSAVRPERAGSASALSETSSELGGALGIAILGSIGTVVYRNNLIEFLPKNISPADGKVAMSTLGGALEVAGKLPAQQGTFLTQAAREAFTSALQTMAVIGIVLAVALALLVIFKLKSGEKEPEPETQPKPKPLAG